MNTNKSNDSTEREDFVTCPRCGQEVFKEAIICPFCKFGILAWLEKTIDESGNSIKTLKKNRN